LNAYWGFESAEAQHAYRGGAAREVDRADAAAVKRGLVAYLGACGEDAVLERLRAAEISVEAETRKATVTVRLAEEDARWFERDTHGAKALEAACAVLLDAPGGVRVRVRRVKSG
jgi:hypothetical protein